MIGTVSKTDLIKNTSHKVVLPFYIYGALSFLAATILLFLSAADFTQHYFHPHTLAITHAMALGWGVMIILGASHQLVPVLIEGKLYSNTLAFISFILAAVGIPLLVYAFYIFHIGLPARWGGILINGAILAYLINVGVSLVKSKHENVQAIFIFTAALWLLITTLLGLLLVYNFSYPLLSKASVSYLPLHAHIGIIGWFLLLVIGVGSRLIPLFLISKYSNPKLLWWIYLLTNGGLISFIVMFLFFSKKAFYVLPLAMVITALFLFGCFCYHSYKQRIRKQVDEQMKISMLSVLMTIVPLILLLMIIGWSLATASNSRLVLAYGFTIFFGWITAIILGMTFKTLPFIAWNKVYHAKAGLGKTPNPKELFSEQLFMGMAITYLAGFIFFATGILLANVFILKSASLLLLIAAFLYNLNVFKIVTHQPTTK
ncbi:MAG: cytochrome C oxidase subunit I [Ferruginibacter sp.]